MNGRHVHKEPNFSISYISMIMLTSSKIPWINCGVTVMYSRHYDETVCKVLLKNNPYLSQCFHCSLSRQVSVKNACGLRSWSRVLSGDCSSQCAPSLSWGENGDPVLAPLPPNCKCTSSLGPERELPMELGNSYIQSLARHLPCASKSTLPSYFLL